MSTIKLRRSGIPGKLPTTTQLDLGELALNTYDGRIYIKKSVNSVESIVGFYGAPVSENSITLDTYTGDGSTTEYSLSRVPNSEQHVHVYLNGVLQHTDAFTISGSTVTLSEAPLASDDIEIRVHDNIVTSVSVRDYARYVYTATNATSFSGSDDNSNVLAYDPGFLEVYVNGSRLVEGSDFTATDGTSFTIQEAVTGTVEAVSLSKATFVDDQGGFGVTSSSEDFTTTNADQVADSFNSSAYRTAKYLIQMSDGTDFHATEVLLIHDGTTVYMTEYGTIFSNASMGTVDADISNNYVRLLVTPTNINTTVKTKRIAVTV